MTTRPLDTLRGAMEGVVASVLATRDAAGMPNVSLISQVHYVDPGRVALSYQFFNKTRRNLLATRLASVAIFDPETLEQHRLHLDYEETLTSGPLFENMKAKLAGIASHHGMESVFRLLGADIFRVRSIEAIPCVTRPPAMPTRNLLAAARATCRELDGCRDLETLLTTVLDSLEGQFGIAHSMVLVVEQSARRLYTVASRGYLRSGIGSEVAFGDGVIGVAAREGTPIRIGHVTADYCYGAALRDSAQRAGIAAPDTTDIPFPGLPAPASQIAMPISIAGQCIGVLFAEATQAMRFRYDDEDALAIVAGHLGSLMTLLREEDVGTDPSASPARPASRGAVTLRHYAADGSIFLAHDYLIKGVAGAILWRLVSEHVATGRSEFTTRELRLDSTLRLPDHAENVDARLILLRRRLEEREACIRIEKSGRGRFRLCVACDLTLELVSDKARAGAG